MSNPVAIIADDEEHLRIGLRNMLQRLWPELEIRGEAADGHQALALIQAQRPDFAFLDIQMPGMTGMEVASKVTSRTRVVFVTAYDQYAVQAFENEAVDYVLKPATEQRMEMTVARLKQNLVSTARAPHPDDPSLHNRIQRVIQVLEKRQTPRRLRLVKVKTGSEVRLVPVAQVIFFKAEDKYTVVQTAERQHLIKTPIKSLARDLDPDRFWRVHRSAIVNIDKIHKINRSFTHQMIIAFNGTDETVAVSRSYEYLFK